ncbi:MAG: ATP-binding protein [Gallionella sp.]|nr:ATP-binding protein [Gallionella sp.]
MKQFSIRQYVAWLTLIPVFIIVASMELFFLRHYFSQMDQSMLDKGELLVHQLAASSEYGVFSNNMSFLQDIANSALQQSDIRGVAIFDVDTRMLASAGEFSSAFKSEIIERKAANRLQFAHTGDIDEAIVLHPATNDASDLWLFHAIIPTQIAFDDFGSRAKIKPTGSVILEISLERHAWHKTRLLWATLLATLLFLVIASYLIYVASRGITSPIRELSDAVTAIGAGKLDTRVKLETSVTELATLVQGLNKTTEHLEHEQEVMQQCIEDATLALRAKKEEAERASHDKSRFLAVASHDLRQPLHALGLYVAELQRKMSGTAQQRLSEQIGQSVDALAMLLNALLDISKLDAGAVVPQIRTCSVEAMLQRIAADYQMLAAVKNIRLVIRPCAAHVTSDPLLLERILSNLISNAIRYTEQNGSVMVACRRRGNLLRIEVRDNGIGISKTDQGNIFREFFQLAQPHLNTQKGLGLGLAIVDRLVKLLGHRIELRSEPGKGTVFALEVTMASRPVKSAVDISGRFSHYQGEKETAAPAEISPLAGKRLLVVDDDPAVLSGTASAMSSWGCQISTAGSVAEVVQLIRGGTEWDFIVSDYQLGNDTNGIDVINLVRQHQNQPVPCLLITGDTSQAVLKLVSVSGYQLLHKPVRPAKLRSMIVHLLEEGARQS